MAGALLPLVAACQQQAETPVARQEGGLNLEAAVAGQAATGPVVYSCAGDQTLSVRYDGAGLARVAIDGREVALTARPAERGVLYNQGEVSWQVVQAEGRETGTLTAADGTVTQCSRAVHTAAPPPALTACRADQLTLSAGDVDAGMGHRNLPVTVTAKGPTGCLLPQWPQASLLPASAAKGVKVERTTDSYFIHADAETRIALEPGQFVQFFVGWSVIPHEADGEQACPDLEGLEVLAPGGGRLGPLAVPMQVCGGRVTISPFSRPAGSEDGEPKSSQ